VPLRGEPGGGVDESIRVVHESLPWRYVRQRSAAQRSCSGPYGERVGDASR
jgi:hypothetical protein